MNINPEKTPMIELLKQAYRTAEVNGRPDIMMRCQAIANIAEKLDNNYKLDLVPVVKNEKITPEQINNRKLSGINDVQDFMLICIRNGMEQLGFTGQEFE